MFDGKELSEAIETAQQNENALLQIMTLAAEYEGKHLTTERFAARVLEICQHHARAIRKRDQRGPQPRNSPEDK